MPLNLVADADRCASVVFCSLHSSCCGSSHGWCDCSLLDTPRIPFQKTNRSSPSQISRLTLSWEQHMISFLPQGQIVDALNRTVIVHNQSKKTWPNVKVFCWFWRLNKYILTLHSFPQGVTVAEKGNMGWNKRGLFRSHRRLLVLYNSRNWLLIVLVEIKLLVKHRKFYYKRKLRIFFSFVLMTFSCFNLDGATKTTCAFFAQLSS